MIKKLIIFGAKETALLAYEYFKHDSLFDVIAFTVNKEYLEKESINNLPVVVYEDIVKLFPPEEGYYIFVALSSNRFNRHRTRVYEEVKQMGYKVASYISSKAFVWQNAKIGENCFIFEDNTIQPFVEIGNNVTLWSGNHIGHNTVIEDNCFITSHCVISGFCKIGKNSYLGVNSTIENNTVIAKDNFIGANAVIRKNTEAGQIFQEPQTKLHKLSTYKFFRLKEDEI